MGVPNLVRHKLFMKEGAQHTLILSHGAGAGMDSFFMSCFAKCLSDFGVRVVCFEFPYMTRIRSTGVKRPPDKMPDLVRALASVVQSEMGSGNVFIGGKSMGGRVATMLVANDEYKNLYAIQGCICLGYPFHPQGKLEKLRIEHFAAISCPVHIVQGEIDPFGRSQEIAGYTLPASISIDYIAGGNHDFKSAKKYGFSHEEQLARAANSVFMFMDSVMRR